MTLTIKNLDDALRRQKKEIDRSLKESLKTQKAEIDESLKTSLESHTNEINQSLKAHTNEIDESLKYFRKEVNESLKAQKNELKDDIETAVAQIIEAVIKHTASKEDLKDLKADTPTPREFQNHENRISKLESAVFPQ